MNLPFRKGHRADLHRVWLGRRAEDYRRNSVFQESLCLTGKIRFAFVFWFVIWDAGWVILSFASNRLRIKSIAKSRLCLTFSFVYRFCFVNFLKLLLVSNLFLYLCNILLLSYTVSVNKKNKFFCYVPDFS